MPIVLAADRSGVAFGKALNSMQAAEIAEALRPAVAMDFHSGGGRGALLPAPRAVAQAAPCGPEPIRRPARVRAHHIQTVGNRQGRFRAFLLGFHDVATKYLGNHLLWSEFACVGETASPSSCLEPPLMRRAEDSRNEPFDCNNSI